MNAGEADERAKGGEPEARPVDAAERAYQEIRHRIAMGELEGGARLTESSLGEMLSMSRTPIRTALTRLDAEGFVTLTPKRGAVIAEDAVVDPEEFHDIRERLERHAAMVAAERRTPEQLADLRALVQEVEAELESHQRPRRHAERNARFHILVAEMSRRRRLAALISGLYDIPILEDAAGRLGDHDLRAVWAQHSEIVEAIAGADPEWAGSAMLSHLRSSRRMAARVGATLGATPAEML
ncbi:MAG: GntR family transcriptional regulator [Actinobacteria bacterium]|nr:GntR family transcriptional regulator [Actinomycetota bacterium]